METKEISEFADPILEKLVNSISPIVEKVEVSNEHAVLVLGVKQIDDQELGEGVQTYFAASGFLSSIAEGLYAELSDQISSGNPALFSVIRQVINDLEEDYGISNDDHAITRPTIN